MGLCYHYGLFRQKLTDNKQSEIPDPWLEDTGWRIPTEKRFTVSFGKFDLAAVLWDIAVPGAYSGIANRLHLFDVEDPAPAPETGIDFDKTDIRRCLTSFLYPDDSDQAGRLLRVYQQYFMVSAGAQLILAELKERGYGPKELADHVVIQINDTHPSMVIPELVRLLTAEGLTMDEAVDQVRRTCAYTNHTILAEALEKWPLSFIKEVAPQLVPILEELDRRVRETCPDPKLAILDKDGLVHMAHLDIHYGFSVQQQDQRRHPPPVAGGLQPGAHRPHRRYHRPRLAQGPGEAGGPSRLPGRRGGAGEAGADEGGGEKAVRGPPARRPGGGAGPGEPL